MADMDQPPQVPKTKMEAKAPKKPYNPFELTEEEEREMNKDPVTKFFDNLTARDQKISIGQVTMTAPKSWTRGLQRNNEIGSDSYQAYNVAGDDKAHLAFYYRGRRTSDFAGELFVKTLKQAPHELSDSEFRDLYETMRRVDSSFTKKSARTEKFNGRSVLILEGVYHKGKPEQSEIKSFFIDSDGTGTAVQELYFQAAPDKFQKYSKEVEQVLKTITW